MKHTMTLFAIIWLFFLLLGSPADIKAEETSSELIQLLEGHGAIILLVAPENKKILYANNTAVTFYGYTKEELETMEITDLNVLTAEELELEERNAAKEDKNYYESQHRLANGETRTVEIFASPGSYQNRPVEIAIIHDITAKSMLQQKNAMMSTVFTFGGIAIIAVLLLLVGLLVKSYEKQKIRTKETETFNALLKTFIDADNRIIYLKDEHFNYILMNQAAEHLYKKTSEEIIGRNDFQLLDHTLAQQQKKTDLEVLKRRTYVTAEIQWADKTLWINKFPVKMMNGTVGIGAHINDITKEKANQKLKEKEFYRNMILVDVLNHNFKDRQELIDYVIKELTYLIGCGYGYIFFYNEETKEFKFNATYGDLSENCTMEKRAACQLDAAGLWGEAVRQRRPILINDFHDKQPLKKGFPERHPSLKNFMSIPITIDNKIVAVLGFANKNGDFSNNDITETTFLMDSIWNAIERKIAQENLAYERHKYLQTLISIGDAVMVVDKEGRIEMLNNVAQELTGWPMEEARGKHYKEVFVISNENEALTINDPIKSVLETKMVQELGNHAILTSRNRQTYHLEDSAAPIKDDGGNTVGVVLVFRDVTEKVEQRKRIEYLSFHDSLTGLYNRRFFEEARLQMDIEKSLPISVILGDVNDLKLTNDVFGHIYGDKLLKKVAEVLRNTCRSEDIITRWGGDEFMILLPNTSNEEVWQIIARINRQFAKETIKAVKVSISMGCDTKQTKEEDIMHTIKTAEEKMYLTKALRRDDTRNTAIDTIIQNFHKSNPKEKEHSNNVIRLCQKMGEALNLPEAEICKLKNAGYLHDIGKIVLEPEIFDLDPSLTKMEIKRHPVVGYRILNSFDNTLDLAEAVLAHHEWWNGEGYPKGLIGDEIPLFARIIALADGYDNMVHPAENEEVLTKKAAIQKIREKAGTHFDPDLAEILIRILEDDTAR